MAMSLSLTSSEADRCQHGGFHCGDALLEWQAAGSFEGVVDAAELFVEVDGFGHAFGDIR